MEKTQFKKSDIEHKAVAKANDEIKQFKETYSGCVPSTPLCHSGQRRFQTGILCDAVDSGSELKKCPIFSILPGMTGGGGTHPL